MLTFLAMKNNEEVKEESEDTKDSKVYELGFLVVPDVSEENLPESVSNIKALIEDKSGVFIAEEYPKLRPLFYEMSRKVDTKKHTYKQAYFGWFKFEIEPENLKEIEVELKANKNILRFIVIKTVRENTMFSHKVFAKKETKATYKKKDDTKKPEASQEEIDKSIEDLVIE